MGLFYNLTRARGGLHVGENSLVTPPSGEIAVYGKSNGNLYMKTADGTEVPLSTYAGSDAPVGSIFGFGGSTAPIGFMIADGTAISRTAYPELFAVIGTNHGAGDGVNTFNLPDLRGRMFVGRHASQTEFDVLGETGGARTYDFTHDHVKGPNLSTVANVAGAYVISQGNYTLTTGSTTLGVKGVLPPYLVGNYIIKVSNVIGGRLPNQIIQMSASPHTAAAGWSKVPLTQLNATPGTNMTVAANGVTINTSGYYRIDANIVWDGGTTGRRIARIIGAASSGTAASGGPIYASSDMVAQDTSWYPGEVAVATRFITAGTHIRLEAYQSTAGTLSNISSNMTIEALFTNPADVEDTGWLDVSFAGAWQNFETGTGARKCQYRRVGKEVKFRGIMKSGTVASGDCFSVPAGFRPESRTFADQYWPCVSNSAFGAISCNASAGTFQAAVGSNVWFDISGVSYFV